MLLLFLSHVIFMVPFFPNKITSIFSSSYSQHEMVVNIYHMADINILVLDTLYQSYYCSLEYKVHPFFINKNHIFFFYIWGYSISFKKFNREFWVIGYSIGIVKSFIRHIVSRVTVFLFF